MICRKLCTKLGDKMGVAATWADPEADGFCESCDKIFKKSGIYCQCCGAELKPRIGDVV